MTATVDVRTGRRAARRRSGRGVLRRMVAAVAGVAFAAAAVWVQTFELSYDERTALLTRKGKVGEIVDVGQYRVKVTSVTAAHAVDTQDYAKKVSKVETSHLFLVVQVSATTEREPMRLNPAAPPELLAEDGRRFRATDKVAQELTALVDRFQPGFWNSGPLVFEVPKDAVRGARLILAPEQGFIRDYSTWEAEIDLGLTGRAADRLISQAEDFHSLVGAT